MIIQTESAFFSQEGSAFVVILEWFVPYLWAFETKLTAWHTVYGKPQVGPFKYQRTLYGKPHGRVNIFRELLDRPIYIYICDI
jgi:hypothetical protein